MKAGIETAPGSYQWSSYGSYIGKRDGLTDTDMAIDLVGSREKLIAFLAEKQESIRDLLTSAGREKSSLEELREEFRRDYLTKKLNLNQKEAEKIITLYHTTYGGWTKWAMMQAVTEFARDVKDIDRRTFLERNAFKVA